MYKFISNVFFFDYEKALDRIALHNVFSPKVPLTVLGYGINSGGECGIVVRQPYVKGRHLSEEDIQRYIEGIGFSRVKDVIATTEYTNDLYYMGDMHDENAILTPGGEIALIDTDSRLNTPDLGYGGRWRIPGLSFSEQALWRIDRVMQRTVPASVSRAEYERRFDNGRNRLREQLAATGRFDGCLLMADDYGAPMTFTLQVDPSDESRLLRIWCEGIEMMVDREKAAGGMPLEEDDLFLIASGKAVKKGGVSYAFDLDRGLIRPCREFVPKKRVDVSQATFTKPALKRRP